MRVAWHVPGFAEIALLIPILKHTPLWVFGLFLGLACIGYFQSKTRLVSRGRLAVLPIAMSCLSLLGVWSSFGASLAAFALWTCALVAVVASGLALAPPRSASYSRESKLFTVPGSWVPLALMMCIFFTKYAVAVTRAITPDSSIPSASIALACTVYGLCSGIFLARALRVAGTARHPLEILHVGVKPDPLRGSA